MAKGSVRKKGKKWYYRFYVEDASGNSVQREFPGSESKSETEAMLRKAMADYEEKQFVAKSENLTLAGLLDKWIEEELKPGSLSNGTVAAYIDTARRIKKHPIADRKLKKISPDHLQSYLDLLSLGGEWPDGTFISLDVPKESAFGFMYLLAKEVGTFDHPFLNGVMPKLPYPHELCCAGVWHSTEEKINVLKALGFHDFDFYQTLLKNPMYTNEDAEDVVPGYQSGGYVAIIAHK